MVAISFKARFAVKVRAGTKRQTIRRERKRPIKAGDTLHFFTGPRMKPERIGEATCKSVERIEIDFVRGVVSIWPESAKPDAGPRAARAHYRVRSSLDSFACSDGFADWLDMRTWFIETHSDDDVFVGVLIRW